MKQVVLMLLAVGLCLVSNAETASFVGGYKQGVMTTGAHPITYRAAAISVVERGSSTPDYGEILDDHLQALDEQKMSHVANEWKVAEIDSNTDIILGFGMADVGQATGALVVLYGDDGHFVLDGGLYGSLGNGYKRCLENEIFPGYSKPCVHIKPTGPRPYVKYKFYRE